LELAVLHKCDPEIFRLLLQHESGAEMILILKMRYLGDQPQQFEIIDLLIQYGADVHHVNGRNQTAFFMLESTQKDIIDDRYYHLEEMCYNRCQMCYMRI
jgi:hypothetical protein